MLQKPAIKKWTPEKLKVLDICQQIQKLAEAFYLHLAEIHREEREIARIWGLLAVDKCNHSDTFKMASRLKGAGISEIYISAETAADLLSKMKTIADGMQLHPPSVVDALRFAIKMEESLHGVDFRHAVKFMSEQDMVLMTSPLKSSRNLVHLMTEEYVNMTLLE